MRRAEASERRHQVHAAVVGDACGQLLDLGRGSHEAETVAHPLHDRAADEHAALQRVLGAVFDSPRDRGHQLLSRGHRPRADVLEEEAPGAVGVLRHAWLAAHLAEEGRLLVTGHAGDRHFGEPERRRDMAAHITRPAYRGQER